MRSMINKFEGWPFYSSDFDEGSGTIVRTFEVPKDRYGSVYDRFPKKGKQYVRDPSLSPDDSVKAYEEWREKNPDVGQRWKKLFSYQRRLAFSPVPETVDLKITNKCGFGCSYCYMGSTDEGEHASMTLIDKLIEGLDQPPYQIAIGGGEPTLHPQFAEIVQRLREWGAVPNYTTAGHTIGRKLLETTNRWCGGVALTYHRHAGLDFFKSKYVALDEGLDRRVQLNVHVIADRFVVESLTELKEFFCRKDGFSRPPSIVLLAYYPDVGRGTWQNAMPKSVYDGAFVASINALIDEGVEVSFSEGLIPFMLTHRQVKVDLQFMTPMEGLFSCYVNDKGVVMKSSFDDDGKRFAGVSIFDERFQSIWNRGFWSGAPNGPPCYSCDHAKRYRCAAPHDSHMLMCSLQPHNRIR